MDAAIPPVPYLDAGRIARVRDVLAGGHLGLEADRQAAGGIRDACPQAPALVTAAGEYHRVAAWRAVTAGIPEFPAPPAAGVIFAGCGYPDHGGFHARALQASPAALFAYAPSDPWALALNLELLAHPDPGHVSAYLADAHDPAAVLGNPHAQEILSRGPVMLQLQLRAHWWPADLAAWVTAEYARRLPPGSTLVMTLAVAGDPEAAEAVARAAGSPFYLHPEHEVARWAQDAGLLLSPVGVRDVRGRAQRWAAAEFARQQAACRVAGLVARVP